MERIHIPPTLVVLEPKVRWSRFTGQFGGKAKIDLGLITQFFLTFLHSIDLVGRPAIERRVRSIGIVVSDPVSDAGSRLAAGLEGGQEHAFIFE